MAVLVGFPVVGFIMASFLASSPGVWRSVDPIGKFMVGQTVVVSFEDASPLPWAGYTALRNLASHLILPLHKRLPLQIGIFSGILRPWLSCQTMRRI